MTSLFDLIKAHARRHDVEPSHDAAQQMNKHKTAQSHAQLIYDVLENNSEPMTAIELAGIISDFDRVEISRRLSGLEDIGKIEKCGIKKHNNKSYSLWKIK